MRKIVIIFIISLFVVNVNAQKVRFGIVASPQLSWIKPDLTKVNKAGARFGLNFGLNIDYFFAKNYAIHTGLTINNTGGKLKFTDPITFVTTDSTFNMAADSEIKYKLQYIDVPLGFKFKTKQIGYFTYTGQFGLTGQINVAARADNDAYDINDAGVSDEIGLFSVGYHIGGGIEYSLGGSTAVTAGILFTNGFIDITKDEQKVDDKSVLNSVAFKVGMMF